MTATLDAPGTSTWTIGPPRLLAGLDRYGTLDHPAHLATHGPLPPTDRSRLIAVLDAIALTGRGTRSTSQGVETVEWCVLPRVAPYNAPLDG